MSRCHDVETWCSRPNANAWIAAFDPADSFHGDSLELFRVAAEHGLRPSRADIEALIEPVIFWPLSREWQATREEVERQLARRV